MLLVLLSVVVVVVVYIISLASQAGWRYLSKATFKGLSVGVPKPVITGVISISVSISIIVVVVVVVVVVAAGGFPNQKHINLFVYKQTCML